MLLDELFEAIREGCDPATWSRAVEMTRSSDILLESEDADETVLILENKKTGPGQQRILRVRLFPSDVDWSCQCEGEDPCAHVAAAAIAHRQATRRGKPLPRKSGGRAGHLGYRLRRTPQGLVLDRTVVQADVETTLQVSLMALTMGRVDGPNVEPTPTDKRIEATLAGNPRGPFPRPLLARLIDLLAHCPDVRLDGEPVKASGQRSVLHGRVVDHPEGFKLFVEQDPAVVEIFPSGAVLLEAGVLQAVGECPLTGRELDELRRGRVYRREEATVLATEIVPSLSAKIPFEIRTRRLPRLGGRVPVRILVETEARGDSLSVLPLLVYGDPPIARVDAGRLMPLADVVPVRDMDEERALARRLQAELGLEPGRRTERRGAAAVMLMEALDRWRGEVVGSGRDRFFKAPAIGPRVEVLHDDVKVEFLCRIEGEDSQGTSTVRRADARQVMRAWRAGEEMVLLEGGGMAPLPADWLGRFGPVVADLLAAKEASGGRLPRASLPDLARLAESMDLPPPAGFERLKALVFTMADAIDSAEATKTTDEQGSKSGPLDALPFPLRLPSDLRATLRPYQQVGARWLSFLREAGLGALLADDMGLGKTIETLSVLEGRTLVVAPASVVHNWVSEAERFRPGLRVAVYHGPDRELDATADLTITTYAILRLDADLLAKVEWETAVLDEAQAIKNPDSQVARAAYRLRAGFRVALTGTPVENRLEELWSQIHFTCPGLLGGREDFEARYARPIRDGDAGTLARLRARIRPFMLRRTKAAVAPELPARTDVVLRCTLSENERMVYDAVQAAARDEVAGRLKAGGSVLEALEALLRMRQAACHSALVPGQAADSSAKVELLMETLEEAVCEGHKALVFSQWTSMLDLVEPHLEKAGIAYTRLDGSTRDRGSVVRLFQEEGGPPVMLVSLKAGGTGLNLTAADHVLLLDPWWNPAVEDQAASRAHRIGQTRPVFVHRLVAEDTVEERILALQAHKRALFEAAMGEADAIGRGLSREDLLSLIG